MDKETKEKLNSLYSDISKELLQENDTPTRDSRNAWMMLYGFIDTVKQEMTPIGPNEVTPSEIIAYSEHIKRMIDDILNNTVYSKN